MKKIFAIGLLTLVLGACTENITRNNPALEGRKNDALWRAGGSTTTVDSVGGVTIVGAKQFEQLMLHTSSSDPGTYELGQNENNQAFFVYDNGVEMVSYSTGTNHDDAGQIVIEEYNEVTRTISGTFRFNARIEDQSTAADSVVNFQDGVFYRLPITP